MAFFDPVMFAPLYTYKEQGFGFATTIGTQLVNVNPNRVGLLFSMSSGGCSFKPLNTVSTIGNIATPSSNWILFFDYEHYGALVSQAWFLTGSITGTMYCLEIIYTPKEMVI